MNELPDPLVPAEVDLRGMPWMPVETERLMNSDLWAISTPDEFKTAFRMWMKAWQQVPAGSLPDDDRILAELSGTGRRWARLRPMALRGFVKCSDGRLYHPVIAPKAIEAWERREEYQQTVSNKTERQRRWRDRLKASCEELRALGFTPPPGASLSTLERLLVDARETAKRGTETGKGEGQKQKQQHQPSGHNQGSAVASRRAQKPEPKTGPAWQAYTAAFRQRYGVEPTRNAVENSAMAAFCELVPLEEAPDIAAFYVGHNKAWYVSHQHAVKYLRQDAVGLRTQWLAGRTTTETSARQADKTAARGAVFHDLIEEAREKAA